MMSVLPVVSERWRQRAIQVALMGVALVVLVWRAWPDGRLHVYFLETSGDAVLIQLPSGGYVLIDGGGDPAQLAASLGRRLPFWRRTLDAVVLTLPDSAHLPGQVAALARYRAQVALVSPGARVSAAFVEWRRLLAEARTPVRVVRVGDGVGGGGAVVRVLMTGDGRSDGMVLRLDYGTTSVVFDHVGSEVEEEALVAAPLSPATVLVFPWQRDPRVPIVAALRPRVLVFSDGWEADKPAELTFVERAVGGAALFHERLDGVIEWVSDGREARVLTER